MKKEERCVELAKELIGSYFDRLSQFDKLNTEGLMEAFRVKTDNRALLEHVKVWINILTEARDILEVKTNEGSND